MASQKQTLTSLPQVSSEIASPEVAPSVWRRQLDALKASFPSPWREPDRDQSFEQMFARAVGMINALKQPPAGTDAAKSYLGKVDLPDYSKCHEARLAPRMMPQEQVLAELASLFDGMPVWNHPYTMANVIPPANTPSIIGAAMAGVFSPNIIEGEYSWNVAKTELEAAAMVAAMIGWDPQTAGGLFTFGGTGCYLYGTKYALTRVLGPESRKRGIRVDGQILVSAEGHYVKDNCSDWTGLGSGNVREIQVDEQNRMSIPHLKQVLEECRREGKPVVMVVCTMGTTDAFAIDPIREVREILDSYENAGGCPRPLLYADAVIGWSWLAFKHYDFERNPLQFSAEALAKIRRNAEQMADLIYADAIGCDFHKTGWSPYNCSLFMVKDYKLFAKMLERPAPAYLQDRTAYNPGHYTLETSRSAAYSTAAWSTLKLLGYEGFQVMLGRIIEVEVYFRKVLAEMPNMVCVNPTENGFVTLFRVYPEWVDAKAQYQRELSDPGAREDLYWYNMLQQNVANKLFAMLRDPDQRVEGWEYPPYTSFTAGYRPTSYAPGETDKRYWVYGLKSYPMSPYCDERAMLMAAMYARKACQLVIEEQLAMHAARAAQQQAAAGAEPGADTSANWFGDNILIPLKYLVQQ
ncbi:glutamate/tyrosine decarboxylase-like PLP-dependent enzyme [Symbiobacterium terraclitae]|uniref:Glutamate/tyrosine decarboxylase-like PLP-dependent enzyme n=1 Tax=Symbiobacterium terraclitae TaxID=557451 RepID=A0ABS4JSF5_9FIRM|nr:pyridoxal-dependent decarboxylase [Symbiobacterium terraclitae]MBP2018457.1 glutamate/tyrosine decarboxylase-like PLP-dependent enzyme [Symbiobacterium terraclitae]